MSSDENDLRFSVRLEPLDCSYGILIWLETGGIIIVNQNLPRTMQQLVYERLAAYWRQKCRHQSIAQHNSVQAAVCVAADRADIPKVG